MPNPGFLQSLLDAIATRNPMQNKFLKSSILALDKDEIFMLEMYLKYCTQNGVDLAYLAESYDLFVKDTMKEQIFFKKHGRYRYSTIKEVESKVYFDDSYMGMYMHGLALTAFLWPNHARILRFFKETLPTATAGRYLEIGPGHGFFFMHAMASARYDKYTGVDISPTSVAITRRMIESGYFGRFSKYELVQADFLEWVDPGKFDAVVMGEVLEHVERPDLLLRRISQITDAGAYIFVTTCINAPEIDHIFCFRSAQQIFDMVNNSALRVKKHLLLPYLNMPIERCCTDRLPINVALVLEKENE